MIGGIVLAGGASTRMGRPKAGLAIDRGDTFLSRLTRTLVAAGVPRVVVVSGAQPEAVRDALRLRHRAVRVVPNARWEDGQLTSLLAGLDALDEPRLEGVLVALVDVPLVTRATVETLVAVWRRTRAPIVRPARGAEHGHPVIFDRTLFGELRAADPALGAKPVVRRHADAMLDVEVDDPGAFRDFDTPEEYAAVRR